MPSLINLLPMMPEPVWRAWEALALVFLTSGGAGMVLVACLSLAGLSNSVERPLIIMSLAATLAGLAALTLGLEQPQRAWEFLSTPSSTSWTAVGAYILPAFVLACVLVLIKARLRGTPGKMLLWLAAILGAGVLTYASMEIKSCLGREMWTTPWLPLIFAAAGISGACGLALAGGAGAADDSGARVLAGVLAAATLISSLTMFALPPAAPLSGGAFWWHLPDLLCLGACGVSVLDWLRPGRFSMAAALAGIAAAVLVYWKIILMGQDISHLDLTFSGGRVLAATLTGPALLALAGSLGLVAALGTLLSSLWPAPQVRK